MDDYYPGAVDDSEGNIPPADAGKPKTDAETALMPKSLFGDVKPGDTISVKVVHVYQDEVEVEKAVEESEDDEMPGQSDIEGEIASLATEEEE